MTLPRRGRPTLLGLVTSIAAVMVVTGTAPAQAGTVKPRKLTAAATRDLGGAYVGSCGTVGWQRWVKQQGGAPSVISEFLDEQSWDRLQDPSYFTSCWAPYLNRYTRLSLGVPMLPDTGGGTLAQGAAGANDEHFRTLATRLVAQNAGNSYLRVGWEFNGDWQPWRAAADPAAFVAYYRRIVTIMRSVPGAHFSFVWSVNYGYTESDAAKLYPGNNTVDFVGISAYDQGYRPDFSYPLPKHLTARTLAIRRANAWADISAGYRGLDYWARFARAHHRPLAVAEWGLARNTGPGSNVHGGGDDPDFLKRMHAWMLKNNVRWAAYWQHPLGWDGQVGTRADGHNYLPKATAAMKKLFRVKR